MTKAGSKSTGPSPASFAAGSLLLMVVAALFALPLTNVQAFPSKMAQEPEATPTIDLLPALTLPPNPSDADRGAYEYLLNCMACHGN